VRSLLTLLVALAALACATPQRIPPAAAPEELAPFAASGPVPAAAPDEPAALAAPEDDAAARADDDAAHEGADRPRLDPRAAPEDPVRTRVREQILAEARRRLGGRPRLDCSGYVLSAYRAAGVTVRLGPARSRSEALFHASRAVDLPRPGDLAFFHDTHDRNRDGRRGDRFTHVALVEAVDGSEVTLLHRGRRVQRIRMDLDRPSDPERNDQVRIRRPRDGKGTRYLAGELFAAFGALLDGDVTQMLQAGRAAETGGRHPATR
jgi:peptidoglycan DL-endopeptidase CwlO